MKKLFYKPKVTSPWHNDQRVYLYQDQSLHIRSPTRKIIGVYQSSFFLFQLLSFLSLGEWSWGRISGDRNYHFLGDWKFCKIDHEIKIGIFLSFLAFLYPSLLWFSHFFHFLKLFFLSGFVNPQHGVGPSHWSHCSRTFSRWS